MKLIHLSPRVVEAIDAQMTVVGEYGYLIIRVAHGRCAGFEATRTTKVLDDLVGQPPPQKQSA